MTTATEPRRSVETAVRLQCTRCGGASANLGMATACATCAGPLAYEVEGQFAGPRERADQWQFFDLMPLGDPDQIVSLGEGGSAIIELPELSAAIGGARLFLKLDALKNPTGTFKDREASLIISRCRELGLNNLVFYSTGNTGRAYTHYAAQLGLTTFFFMPRHTWYKQTTSFDRGRNNFILLVDDDYQKIAPYAKQFAAANGLTAIAPLHDRTESYATLAYEQYAQMPRCDWFVQTIASGMGPIGFLRGHRNLVRLGWEPPESVPRIACIQSEETNAMYRAFTAGRATMVPEDLPPHPTTPLFEPTLNSTNPVANYPDLRDCLVESNGVITDVSPGTVEKESERLIRALETRRLDFQFGIEKSLLIGFTGIVRLAAEGRIAKDERVLLLATGRGGRISRDVIEPDAIIRTSVDDPKALLARLVAQG